MLCYNCRIAVFSLIFTKFYSLSCCISTFRLEAPLYCFPVVVTNNDHSYDHSKNKQKKSSNNDNYDHNSNIKILKSQLQLQFHEK